MSGLVGRVCRKGANLDKIRRSDWGRWCGRKKKNGFLGKGIFACVKDGSEESSLLSRICKKWHLI